MQASELVVIQKEHFFKQFEVICRKVFKEEHEKLSKLPNSESAHVNQKDRLIDKWQAAKLLGCSVSTIDNLRRSGKLTRIMVGKAVRFRLSEVESLMTPQTA